MPPWGRVSSQHPSARLFDLMSGMMRTQTIAAIAELGVADAIAAGVTGTDELAREVGADSDALRRMLRLLEADGLVSQDAPGVWRLSEVGELLRDGVEGSMRQQAMLFGAELYEAWAGATTSLRTGEPAFAAHFGSPFFEWLQQHPVRGRSFDRAMSGTATLRLAPLLSRDWSRRRHRRRRRRRERHADRGAARARPRPAGHHVRSAAGHGACSGPAREERGARAPGVRRGRQLLRGGAVRRGRLHPRAGAARLERRRLRPHPRGLPAR